MFEVKESKLNGRNLTETGLMKIELLLISIQFEVLELSFIAKVALNILLYDFYEPPPPPQILTKKQCTDSVLWTLSTCSYFSSLYFVYWKFSLLKNKSNESSHTNTANLNDTMVIKTIKIKIIKYVTIF